MKMKIAWIGKHFGEEPIFNGDKNQGAGGIFFSGCNLHCVFCQNYQISQESLGEFFSVEQLAEAMLKLQVEGAYCIDLVTPTIWWQGIKEAIILAKEKGLILPIVWNSNAYEKVEVLKEMEGLIDFYLPDFKYSNNELAEKYSGIKNYVETAEAAIKEMIRQTFLKGGLVVRHLVLPNNLPNSLGVLDILAKINPDLTLSLMSQYSPMYNAKKFPELMRPVSKEEFLEVYNYLQDLGFTKGWVQDLESREVFIPDFTKEKPFN